MRHFSGIWALLLLVFAIRAMVPAGFMPDMGAGSGHLIMICSGVEMKQIVVGEDGQPVQKQEAPCPYSFLSAAMNSVDAPEIGTVWYRAEFSEPVFSENDVLHDLYHAGQFVLIHAPPFFS
ncbi:MAG TPA: hypothetical protein PKI93_08625 [Alphaproteobacteria bacterium]|nr:hypothetical protein [Alphaproteobacteria bacterium]HNS44238.1 hypothetical protein [Alphaproteobacteria bacterium]